MAEHAPLSPSSIARLMYNRACFGLNAQFPQLGDPDDAEEGTAAHEVNYHWALLGIPPPVGQPMSNGIAVTEEMLEGLDLWQEVLEGIVDCPEDLRNGLVHYEERVDIPLLHPTDCWGTPDAWYYSFLTGVLHVPDYKFGFKYVDAFELWQGLAYAAGLIRRFPGYKYVQIHIVQPRAHGRHEGPHRSWKIDCATMDRYLVRMQQAIAEDNGKKPEPHEDWCHNCNARHACQALQRSAQIASQMILPRHNVPLDTKAAGVELSLFKRAQALLDARVNGLEAQIAGAVMAGEPVDGWTLERSAGKEVWTCPPEEIATLGELYGSDLRKPLAVLTPSQSRKALKGKLDPTLLEAYTERKRGEPKLIKVDTALSRRVFSSGL